MKKYMVLLMLAHLFLSWEQAFPQEKMDAQDSASTPTAEQQMSQDEDMEDPDEDTLILEEDVDEDDNDE